MAFPPPVLNANVGGPILDPGDHPGHHNALAAAVNDIVEHVSTLEGGGGSASISDDSGNLIKPGTDSGLLVATGDVANVRRNIVQNTDTGGDQTTPLEVINLNYSVVTSSPDVEQVRINGTVSASRNEWGALRGHSPFNWGDSLVRAIVQPGSGINQGNALEIQDRSVSGNPVLWGRHWRTGNLMRNNITMADTYVTNASTTDATINALGLPNGTIVVEITGA